jgi:hypothetical protein
MTFAMQTLSYRSVAVAACRLLSLIPLHAQGTLADYQRARVAG